MGRDHFAQYRQNKPDEYQAFSDNLWNSFVGVTHTIGLGKFFSFTPDFVRGLDGEAIGKQLGEVYNQAEGRFAEGEIPGDQNK